MKSRPNHSNQTFKEYTKTLTVLVVVIVGVLGAVLQTYVPAVAQMIPLQEAGGQQTTNATSNITTNIEYGPQMIQFAEPVVGMCYPWLMMKHTIMNLPMGTIYPGVGGDSAVSVYCGGDYFAVRGNNGVYIFRMDIGYLYRTLFLSDTLRFVDFKHDAVALYDASNNVVFVSNVKADSDVTIKLSAIPLRISFDIVNGLPVIVYSVGSVGNASYVVATPGGEIWLPYVGYGATAIHGDTVYLEANGIKLIKIDALALTYKEIDYIPLPFRVTDILSVYDRYLLASSYGILVLIDVEPSSPTYKTFRVVGEARITPVGYFVPQTGTTYVILPDRIEPVPGYAVAVFYSAAAFTNIIAGNESVQAVLWPFRTTVLVVTKELRGVMYSGGHAIAVHLPPGRYSLPRGAVIRVGAEMLLLDSDIVTYPELRASADIALVPSVAYYVTEFPSRYLPLDVIDGVKAVYVEGGYAVLIRDRDAIVYGPYGATARIPGTWMFGGVGDCVVLYDGNLRLYDFAGNPLTNYLYYVPFTPDYVTCLHLNGAYIVEIYVGTIKYVVGPKISTAEVSDVPRYRDPGGLEVMLTVPPKLSMDGFDFGLPTGAQDIYINKYRATWRIQSNVYILSIPDKAVFVLVNAPTGKTFYPLEDYVLMYDSSSGTVEVLPYKAWFVGGCYIDLTTDSDADVYVNNRLFGTGSMRIYAPCNRAVNVETTKPYHKPAKATVYVVKPTSLDLRPTPIIANVVLDVVAPNNLTISTVVVKIDGVLLDWRVGETRRFLAKTYSIEVIEFRPADVCEHYSFNQTFVEGDNKLTITCRLTAAVLAVYSRVPASVRVFAAGVDIETGVPLRLVDLVPNEIRYIPVSPGSYTIVSEPDPSLQGYTRRIINVTIPDLRVVVLDVTPAQYGKLVVEATVPIASIEVYSETGTVAAGVGKVEVSLPPGTYVVRATAPNYRPFMTSAEVRPGEITTVTAVLIPLPQQTPPPQPPIWQRIEFQISAIAATVAAAVFAMWYRRRKKHEVPETEVS